MADLGGNEAIAEATAANSAMANFLGVDSGALGLSANVSSEAGAARGGDDNLDCKSEPVELTEEDVHSFLQVQAAASSSSADRVVGILQSELSDVTAVDEMTTTDSQGAAAKGMA